MGKDRDKFMIYCGITAGKSSLVKIEQKLNIIDKNYTGNLNNTNLEELHAFLSWLNKSEYALATRNDIIKTLKRYLRWKYSDWSKRFNDLRDCRINGNAQRKLSKEDLLTETEMKLIINSTDSMKYKTLLLFFQETACRPEEVLKLLWKDIDFNKGEVKLFSAKTGKTRFIPIEKTIEHLKRYKTECFYETPKNNDRVFTLTNSAVSAFLLRTEQKIKFPKHLYPYLWRHTILSKMIRTLSPKVYEMYAGHSLETGMKIYAHLDTEDLKKELNEKVYHIEKLSPGEKKEFDNMKKRLDKLEKELYPLLHYYENDPQLPVKILKNTKNQQKKTKFKIFTSSFF